MHKKMIIKAKHNNNELFRANFATLAAAIAVLAVFAFPVSVRGTEYLMRQTRFEHITVEDGLSQNSVNCILQDSHGFMWIGTESGLNRYNGYDFTVYQYDPHDPGSLSDNHVTDIYEDSEGLLWITTKGGGVNRFDPRTEIFTRFQPDPENPDTIEGGVIFSVFQDSRGIYWFGGPPRIGGLNSFDPKTGVFTRHSRSRENPEGFRGGAVWDFTEDEEENIWMAAGHVLARFNLQDRRFTYYYPEFYGEFRIAALLREASGVIWVGGSDGLYQFDPRTETFSHFPVDRQMTVDDIFRHDNGMLWISTHRGGLNVFDPKKTEFIHQYTNEPLDRNSLNSNWLFEIYRDRAGIIWIGSKRGLNLYDPRQAQFAHYRRQTESIDSLLTIQYGELTAMRKALCGSVRGQPLTVLIPRTDN